MFYKSRWTTGRIHLVASLGGHLEELDALRPAFSDWSRIWVTSEGSRSAKLVAEGETVRVLPRLDRSNARLHAIIAGVRTAVSERPSVVVTTGAGVAIPFVAAARVLGARIYFVESGARVINPSASGRVLSRLASLNLVQWETMLKAYARSTLCRPVLLTPITPEVRVEPLCTVGTFVSVGSHDQSFDRLLRAADNAARAGLLPSPVFFQTGVSTYSPQSGDAAKFVSPTEFTARLASAEVVVLHGGLGAIATALQYKKRPIVVSRLRSEHEHVDDHQLELVEELNKRGVIVGSNGRFDAATVQRARTPVNADELALSGARDAVSILRESLDDLRRDVPFSGIQRR